MGAKYGGLRHTNVTEILEFELFNLCLADFGEVKI